MFQRFPRLPVARPRQTGPLLRLSQLSAALVLLLLSNLAQAESQWLRYRIPGMNCPGCGAQLRSEILRVPGVKQVQVQRSKEEIKVIYDDELADVLDIETAIATVGFVGTLSARSR